MSGAMGPGVNGAMGPGMNEAMGAGMNGAMGAGMYGAMGPGTNEAMGAGLNGATGPWTGSGMNGAMGPGLNGAMGPGMPGAMGTFAWHGNAAGQVRALVERAVANYMELDDIYDDQEAQIRKLRTKAIHQELQRKIEELEAENEASLREKGERRKKLLFNHVVNNHTM
jgi:hypothetical protein